MGTARRKSHVRRTKAGKTAVVHEHQVRTKAGLGKAKTPQRRIASNKRASAKAALRRPTEKELKRLLQENKKAHGAGFRISGMKGPESADFSNMDLRGVDFAKFGISLFGIKIRNSDLRGANFSGLSLIDIDFRGCNLAGVNLHGADLTDADFRRCDLSGADLSETTLFGADFRWANLTNVNMRKADSYGAWIVGANLTNADLRDTGFSKFDLTFHDNEVKGAKFRKKKIPKLTGELAAIVERQKRRSQRNKRSRRTFR